MRCIKIVQAANCPDAKALFLQAQTFLLAEEKFNCALMQRVLNEEESVFLILNTDSDKKDAPCSVQAAGVFSYNIGKSLSAFIPDMNEEIKKELALFFKDKKIHSITGEGSCVSKLEAALCNVNFYKERRTRELFLMEQTCGAVCKPAFGIVKECSLSDGNLLMPLQVAYDTEEEISPWKKIPPAAERMVLDKTLRTLTVFGIFYKDTFIAKANTNAQTNTFVQLGGVYTKKEFRGKNLAAALVCAIADKARAEGKKTILFVRQKNISAIRSYTKAGFTLAGNFKIVYFR